MQRWRLVTLALVVGAVTSGFPIAPTSAAAADKAAKPGLGKSGILDIVPSDAALSFAIRNLQDLKRKGDTFLEKTGLQIPVRPSQIFDFALGWIGIQQGVDDQSPIALIMVNLEKVGAESGKLEELEKTLVLAIPFNDRDQIAASFSLKGADLKPDKIIRVAETPKNFDLRGFVAVRGKHLLMSAHAPAIQLVLDDKPIRQTIGEKQQQLLDRSDLLLQVGPRSWGQQWKSIVQEASKDAVGDSREEQLIHRFGKALRNFRLGLVGARIDGGLSINIISLFDDVGEAQELLTELAAGT